MASQSRILNFKKFAFLEFFAGGGMARAGLGRNWDCLLANDFDSKKADSYRENWGDKRLWQGDIHRLPTSLLPDRAADLAWASFPCQDLSLAGSQAGLNGKRSAAFWGFWKVIEHLKLRKNDPRIIVLENVTGALTSNGGRDFRKLLDTLRDGGYRSGALVVDAVHFLPHSRPRLFIIAVRSDQFIPRELVLDDPHPLWRSSGLDMALKTIEFASRQDWISWRLPFPPKKGKIFSDLIDENPVGVNWHSTSETNALLKLMSPINLKKVRQAQLAGRTIVGTLYKRTRMGSDGSRKQRAEVRFDEVAGCLRTPGGGSSRQTIVVVHGKSVRSRLLSPREAARLMGLEDNYRLPHNYNEAYHLIGDGVAVPVVRHLAEHLIEPLVRAQTSVRAEVA